MKRFFTVRNALLLVFFVSIALNLSYWHFASSCCRPLTREDLPRGAVPVRHVHNNEGKELDAAGHAKGEMEHWATPEAIKNGGPTYGVYGYSIVAIEYEVPESMIGAHEVGKEFSGWNLSSQFLGFNTATPYDHFHIGIKAEASAEAEDVRVDTSHHGEEASAHKGEKTYLIHYMLIPHEEELRIGLSCG